MIVSWGLGVLKNPVVKLHKQFVGLGLQSNGIMQYFGEWDCSDGLCVNVKVVDRVALWFCIQDMHLIQLICMGCYALLGV